MPGAGEGGWDKLEGRVFDGLEGIMGDKLSSRARCIGIAVTVNVNYVMGLVVLVILVVL